MKTNLLKQLVPLLCAVLLVTACHNDPVENELTIVQEQSLRLDMLPQHIQNKAMRSQEHFQNMGVTFIGRTTDTQGDDGTSSRDSGGTFGTVDPSAATHTVDRSGRDTYALTMEKGDNPRAMDNMVIVDKGNGETAAFVIRHLPTDDWYAENREENGFGKGFSGILQIFNEEQGLISATQMRQGKLLKGNDTPSNGKYPSVSKSARGSGCFVTDVQYAGLFQAGVFYVTEIKITVECTGGGGSGGGDPFGDGSGSNPDEGGGGGSSGGGTSGTSTNFLDYEHLVPDCPPNFVKAPVGNGCLPEDNVINELSGRAKCVYEKLKSLNGNLFKKTIGAFIDDPEYDLTLQIGNCSRTNDACTNLDNTNNIVIIIEDTNQSSLGLAALILHEGIHAEMHRYVSRFESGVDPNNRARLLQLYAFYKGWANTINNPNYIWRSDAHHAYMVENYVEKIASAVRNLDNNRYPLSHYMAYGWDGLRDSGYNSKKLNSTQNSYYLNLRSLVENNFTETCKL